MKKLLALTLLVSILGSTTAGCFLNCGVAPYDSDGQVFTDGGDASSDGAPATDGAVTPATTDDGGAR